MLVPGRALAIQASSVAVVTSLCQSTSASARRLVFAPP